MPLKLDPTSGRYFPDEAEIRKLPRKNDLVENNWSKYPESFSDSMLSYQNWFDSCESIDSCIAKGEIDFHTRILTGDLYRIIGDPREKSALDIGFGGGRLMLAASRIFKNISGVDVLSEEARSMTRKFLDENSTKKYSLYNPDTISNIPESSIDFVYSYIVFQHFNSIDYFHKYFSEIKRVLKPGAVGVIFFGLVGDSVNPNLKNVIKSDGFFHWHDKFEEGSRGSTLYYDPAWIKKQVSEDYNMSIIDMMRFTKQPWAPKTNLSSQFCVRFVNNRDK